MSSLGSFRYGRQRKKIWWCRAAEQVDSKTPGAIAGQVKQAEALQQAALESYENAILSAFSEVENALVSRQKLSENVSKKSLQPSPPHVSDGGPECLKEHMPAKSLRE
jgi:hypothetical protein